MEFEEIDKIVEEADNYLGTNEFYEVVRRIRVPYQEILSIIAGKEPFSQEYISGVRAIHQWVIRKKSRETYSFDDEGMNEIDPENEIYCDWPLGSVLNTGRFLHAYADIVTVMNLQPGALVLEPGCGLGSLTELLARMDYCVDAVDVNEKECLVTQKRLQRLHRDCNVVCSELESFLENSQKKYDAVVFFEAFHHFMDHYRILKRIKNKNLRLDGKIILSGEPIFKDSIQEHILPYPWGPRFDGESVYQMRKRGWLELGFRESYIREMAEKLEMRLTHIPSKTGLHGTVWLLENKSTF